MEDWEENILEMRHDAVLSVTDRVMMGEAKAMLRLWWIVGGLSEPEGGGVVLVGQQCENF